MNSSLFCGFISKVESILCLALLLEMLLGTPILYIFFVGRFVGGGLWKWVILLMVAIDNSYLWLCSFTQFLLIELKILFWWIDCLTVWKLIYVQACGINLFRLEGLNCFTCSSKNDIILVNWLIYILLLIG